MSALLFLQTRLIRQSAPEPAALHLISFQVPGAMTPISYAIGRITSMVGLVDQLLSLLHEWAYYLLSVAPMNTSVLFDLLVFHDPS